MTVAELKDPPVYQLCASKNPGIAADSFHVTDPDGYDLQLVNEKNKG
jgi:hypothetical protein